MTFEFNDIALTWPNFKAEQLVLWIWNADKIPPHIGLSFGRNYVSLTYKGLEDKLVSSQLQKAKRMKCPMVFVTLNTSTEWQEIRSTFDQFDFAKPGGATCLTPIIQLLKKEQAAKQLFELLATLQNEQQIEGFFGVHLPDGYSKLPEYSYAEIVKRIDELHAASR